MHDGKFLPPVKVKVKGIHKFSNIALGKIDRLRQGLREGIEVSIR